MDGWMDRNNIVETLEPGGSQISVLSPSGSLKMAISK